MKIIGLIAPVSITSMNTEPREYNLSITGTGTLAECNHVMDLLMQDGDEALEGAQD